MKQHVIICVLPEKAGESFLMAASGNLKSGRAGEELRAFVSRDMVLFYSEHLDLWSMGDSFERLLRPRKHLRIFEAGSTILYTMPRKLLQPTATPRNDEEQLFRDLLQHALRAYRKAIPEAHFFVLRTVFGVSGDDCFSDEQDESVTRA